MKILFLAPDTNLYFQQSGGAGTHMRASIEELSNIHDVKVAIGGDLIRASQLQEMDSPPPATMPALPLWRRWLGKVIPEFLKRIYRDALIRKKNAIILQLVEKFLEKEGLPDIIYERSAYGYDVGMKISQKYKLPRCMETDVIMLDLIRPTTSLIFNRFIYRSLEAKKYQAADGITVQSAVSVPLAKSYWNLSHDRIFNKDLGITLKKFAPVEGLDVETTYGLKGKFVVGYTGIFQPFHRMELLLEAANYLPKDEVAILIVGTGNKIEAYKKYISNRNLDHVIFTGLVDKKVIGNYYAAMDLSVVPGCAYHMYPVKFLEIGGLQIPGLTPRYEVFKPFYSSEEKYLAHTFDAQSARHLAEQIMALKEAGKDPAELAHLKSYILTHHTWEECGKKLDHAIGEIYKHAKGKVNP